VSPHGNTPEAIRNHSVFEGVEIGNTSARSRATKLVTKSLLIYAEGRGAPPPSPTPSTNSPAKS